jgi:low affinity Fe/Cu permease
MGIISVAAVYFFTTFLLTNLVYRSVECEM